jgi:hypothetical protein
MTPLEGQAQTHADGTVPAYYTPVDPATMEILVLARAMEEAQRLRIAFASRGDSPSAKFAGRHFASDEATFAKTLRRSLREHPLWDWIAPLKGLTGPRMARVIGRIRNPHRFPGLRCSTCGSHTVPGEGPACARTDDQGAPCSGTLERRPGKGVRALWHYAGLHVVDGRLPRRRRGVKCTWNNELRTLLLGPKGIGDLIVMKRTPRYREVYDEQKRRLMTRAENPLVNGSAHSTAKIMSCKALLGDLLIEWKRSAPLNATAGSREAVL